MPAWPVQLDAKWAFGCGVRAWCSTTNRVHPMTRRGMSLTAALAALALTLTGCLVEPGADDPADTASKPASEAASTGDPGKTGIKVAEDDEGGGAELAKAFDTKYADAAWYPHITEISQFAGVRLINTDLHKVTEAEAKTHALAICDAAFDVLGLHKTQAEGFTVNREDDSTTVAQYVTGPNGKNDCYWLGINGSAEPSR